MILGGSKFQDFLVPEVFVCGSDYLVAGLEAIQHFEIYRVFTAKGNLTFGGSFTTIFHNIHPVAAGI